MTDRLTLGDLRRLVERLGGQSDDVPVKISITMRGLSVNTGSFPGGPQHSPLTASVFARHTSIGQTMGYHSGMGPASHILIEGEMS